MAFSLFSATKSLHIVHILLIMVSVSCYGSSSSCAQVPIITGYARPYGISVSVYNITWNPPSCHQGNIIQYHIQVVENCLTVPVDSIFTGRNETSKSVVLPHCLDEGCYVRVRAVLRNGAFTGYSVCALINSRLLPNERYVENNEDICVPINASCGNLIVPNFLINGQFIMWPRPGIKEYNVTYSQISQTFSFCFSNVTMDTVLTEVCYQTHRSNCSLCVNTSAELVFISYTTIFQNTFRNDVISSTTSSVILLTHGTYRTVSDTENIIDGQTLSKSRLVLLSTHMTDTIQSIILSTDDSEDNRTFSKTHSILTTVIGVTSTSAMCILIILGILVILIMIHYKKSYSRKIQSAEGTTVYDEPSLPDPVYQEINGSAVTTVLEPTTDMTENSCYNNVMVMTENSSYVHNVIRASKF